MKHKKAAARGSVKTLAAINHIQSNFNMILSLTKSFFNWRIK